MTNEEAKEIFLNRGFVNGLFDGDKWRQSIVVISKWLEQEPCEDAISREEVYKITLDESMELSLEQEHKIRIAVRDLPPVQPISCKDCVSRSEVNAVIDKWIRDNKLHYVIPKELNRLYGLLDNMEGTE